ncbi:precorrin-6y C5,15-methyltransferase (decarboxylating) subunit CbiE [uncultured Bacteroides sp.]|uniref:precorrin-6y C5,15-methyltransferase (decarboxylating) subunit CbiE n=1 Tax=uncultured Bacteroides sp. TaxID=162156 RepID=UPI0026766C40|nr:precorrin-6y C5,15-methyltransferase (decarboxylating) subunit CbiE [uncultured Bacteroides sp.]
MMRKQEKQKFHIIGITDSRKLSFSEEILELIARSHVFSGGKRHREIVSGILPEPSVWIDITVPLDAVFERYADYREIVVFASGDPLFFGFANTVMRKLPDAVVCVYPAFNSLQLLAHKVLRPYHDMRTISLTGRSWKALDEALISGEKLVGSLTDREKTPAAIAARMKEYGYDNYRMIVGERLGNEDERVTEYGIEEAMERCFEMPNCVILKRTAIRERPFGIPEERFDLLDGRVNMITKMPVRLLSLSLLDLRDKSVMWDVGFCTGSVSVEAKLQFPRLEVVAFEKREAGKLLMETNSRRFGCPGITAVIGDFVEMPLENYPVPDAVFIGGHGGRLKEMVRKIALLLPAGGTLVFNSVSEDSRVSFEEAVAGNGLVLEQTVRLAADRHNPIDILKAVKR